MPAMAEPIDRLKAHRMRRRADGFKMKALWLPASADKVLEEAVASGAYKSQSEVVSAALDAFFKSKETT